MTIINPGEYGAVYTAVVDGRDVASSPCVFYRSKDGKYFLNRHFVIPIGANMVDPFEWSEYRIQVFPLSKFDAVCGKVSLPVKVEDAADRLRFLEGSIDLKINFRHDG